MEQMILEEEVVEAWRQVLEVKEEEHVSQSGETR